jgi:capsular polysaccharide transport system permease protein
MTTSKRTSWQIQKAVVFALIMREIKTRFGGHWTGVVWLLGLPLVELAVFMWMNVVLRGRVSRGSYDFMVFLVVALFPYKLFRGLWSQLTHAASANKGLFSFKQVKPMDAFVARVLLELALDTFIFILLAVLLARFGWGPMLPVDVLAYLGVVAMFVLFGVGLGISSAVICDVMPRFAVATQLIAMPLMILSGVVFPLHGMPQAALDVFLLNPVLHLVELARHAYLPNYVPVNGVNAAYPLKIVLVSLALAMSLYRVRRRELIAT